MMMEILNSLFDEYTKDLFVKKMEESQAAQTCYQQLRELAGDETAIKIWDAAVMEGAVMQEECFQAGLKTGIKLTLELLFK